MKRPLYREQSWWHRAVAKDSSPPVIEFLQNERDPALARASLADSVLNCELAKARAQARVKLSQRKIT